MAEARRLLRRPRACSPSPAPAAPARPASPPSRRRSLLDAFPDGVWLVELAPLADPALVPQAVAAALGVREEPGRPLIDTLVDYLRRQDAAAGARQLRAPARRLRRSWPKRLLRACPQLQHPGHQPRGAGHRRRDGLPRAVALAARPAPAASSGRR